MSNVKDVHSCWPEKFYSPLTDKGRKEAEAAAKRLKKKNIDLIFSSDILRTKQTAGIVAKEVKRMNRTIENFIKTCNLTA